MYNNLKKKYRSILRIRMNIENRKRLRNKNFTLLSHNCNGGVVLHDLGLQFKSPTVNLYMNSDDYLKFLENLDHYLSVTDIEETQVDGIFYPVGMLDDIRLFFVHYPSFDEARRKWLERCTRVDKSNLYIFFAQRDGCTREHIERFSELPYEHKVVFVAEPMPDISCAYYCDAFPRTDGEVGVITEYVSRFSGRRYIDSFDYVSFFNER